MSDVRIAILMCDWGTTAANAKAGAKWSKELVREVFQDRNGWSIGSWWDACSLGHRKPQFEVFEVGTLAAVQETVKGDPLLKLVVDKARAAGIPVDTFSHHVAFMNPPPNPAAAYGSGAVLDRDATHQYYAHETGHVLGLDHPFGFGAGFAAIQYADDFCIMGNFHRWHAQPAPALSPQDLAAIGQPLWRYGVMPAGATLYKYWSEFRQSNRVQVLAPGTNGTFNLAAMSEPQLNAPLLYRIPVGPDQDYLIEYRVPTGWDRGLAEPVLVVHSVGLPSRRSATPQLLGLGHVWFEYAIPAPFQDAWSLVVPSIGIEVVGRWSEDKGITLQVTSPAAGKSAALVERRGRVEHEAFPRESGIVWLNSASDPNLCNDDAQPFGVSIVRFSESVGLDLVTSGFTSPVIDAWRINGVPIATSIPPGQTFTVPAPLTFTHIEGAAPVLPHLVTRTITNSPMSYAQLRLETRPNGATLHSQPGGNAFDVHVEVVVRDAAVASGVPSAIRVAAADVHFVGERFEWDDDYKDAAEGCWMRRLQRGTRYLPRYEYGPLQPPPWLDPSDRQIIRRVEERLAGRDKLPPKPRKGMVTPGSR